MNKKIDREGDNHAVVHFAFWPTKMTNGETVWLQHYTKYWEYMRRVDSSNKRRTWLEWTLVLIIRGKLTLWDKP